MFVGHSMGGLVIKRAYIFAKQKEDYVSLADRVEAMFFLATPHRGSDLAPVFSKLLNFEWWGEAVRYGSPSRFSRYPVYK